MGTGGFQSHIYVAHGVVERYCRSKFIHRNFTDIEQFSRLLRGNLRFVSIQRALQGEGSALTIDDSTQAAGRAARMAAEHGHEVTLFINPYYVATGKNYCFARLNAIMDQLPDGHARFEGRYFETETPEKRRILRAAVKLSFCREHTEEKRQRVVDDFACENGIACSIPDHLNPLTPADISALRNQGVTIGNHGWCHPHYSVLSEEEAYEDIRMAREWLQDDSAGCFAVPFGDCLPISARVLNACQVWLLSSSYLSPGFLGSRVFNRTELDAPEVRP